MITSDGLPCQSRPKCLDVMTIDSSGLILCQVVKPSSSVLRV